MPVAKSAVVETTWVVQPGDRAPSFSYQVIVSVSWPAVRTSGSPSRSRSRTAMASAAARKVAIGRGVKVGGEPPSLAYQTAPATMSRSPSWSRSAASTEFADALWTTCGVQELLNTTMFSYQTTCPSKPETEMASLSPSPSRSAAQTSTARRTLNVIGLIVQVLASPPLSYQAISSRLNAADRKSMSESP